MLPRYTKPRTAHLTPQPITKQQVLDAAAHWRRIADDHAAFADRETALGLPRGDVSSYRARARLWYQVADDLEAQAEGMK
ncbi:MAG: hypothetical protein IPK79_00195 [Vampirovibrionales bacterium]|nr:hypothetical protein [Vampirovibrionales bacterium]